MTLLKVGFGFADPPGGWMNYVAMLCCAKRPASMSGVLEFAGMFESLHPKDFDGFCPSTVSFIFISIKYLVLDFL